MNILIGKNKMRSNFLKYIFIYLIFCFHKRFDKDNIIIYDSKIGIVKSTGWNNSESTTMRDRAIFPIIATRDIEKDEEILVKYGTCQSHFKKTSQSSQNSRSTESIERNQRYEIREQKKILDGLKKNQA